MSCFENRDFEGLKVAMRKMPNSQATGEELGRSISCGWDMEAFDMLATVETLKGISRRRYEQSFSKGYYTTIRFLRF